MSRRLSDDLDVVLTAVENYPASLKDASIRLRYTKPEVAVAVLKNIEVLDYVEKDIIKDVVNLVNESRQKLAEEENKQKKEEKQDEEGSELE